MDAADRPTRLGDEERARYRRDGHLFPIRVATPEEAAGWRAEFEALEAAWRDAGLARPLTQYLRSNAQVVVPLAARLATHPAILDAVEGALGPDLLVWSAEFFVKEPRTRQIVSWHQDLTYWGLGATSRQCTAWLALSPATPESGCMRFVAGSHREAIVPHRDTFDEDNMLSRGQEIAVEVDEADAVDVLLSPGEMSLHHGLAFHASGPNRSDDRRIGVAIRYVAPDARQEVADRDYAMLARGVDRTGNFINFAGPDSAFSAASLSLYEEMRAEQAKALAAGVDAAKLYSGQAGVVARGG
ncbi:MAG: phytanoyl-CoA dioxygenase family protein [Pseudomonadota bacterium]